MPTTTTTYALSKPTVGGDTDTWGTLINENLDKIDDLLDGTLPITPAAGNDIDIVGTNAATNTVTPLLTLNSQSSGTPAAGIGAGMRFSAETAAGNTEIGVTLEAVTTDVTSTSEDFDFVVKTMAAGAAASERLRVSSATTTVTGGLTATGTATLNTFASSGATITGGTINSTSVGATTASTVRGTTITATTDVRSASYKDDSGGNNATINGITPINSAGVATALNASGSAPIYAARAWVNFDGTGTPAIKGSGNVTSITDNGVGDFTVNFTTAIADANYAVSAGHDNLQLTANQAILYVYSQATGSVRVISVLGNTSALTDASNNYVIIFR